MPRTSLPLIGIPMAQPRTERPNDFGVAVTLEGSRVIVAVHGELDGGTAPLLRSVLVALVDSGQRQLVVDLAELTFMSAAGIGVLVGALGRLRLIDGSLVLRSAPARTVRMLEIFRLGEHITIEPADAPIEMRLALARAASQPARDRAVDEQLALVVAIADATVGGADGASVTLRRNGRMATVAATNDTVLRMDAHQYATEEGPCLSAAADGMPIRIESLAHETRWPAFVPRALGEGIASILSTPLLAGGASIGALNIYSNVEGVFGSIETELAAVLAGQASRVLASTAAEPSDAEVGARIAAALRSRLVLAQAQGVLMARLRIDAEAASACLHRDARIAEISVLDHATTVVRSTFADLDPVERLGDG